MKNTDKNITNNIKNDVPVAGTDLFADSEDLLNELNDSDLRQIVGGSLLRDAGNDLFQASELSLLLCQT